MGDSNDGASGSGSRRLPWTQDANDDMMLIVLRWDLDTNTMFDLRLAAEAQAREQGHPQVQPSDVRAAWDAHPANIFPRPMPQPGAHRSRPPAPPQPLTYDQAYTLMGDALDALGSDVLRYTAVEPIAEEGAPAVAESVVRSGAELPWGVHGQCLGPDGRWVSFTLRSRDDLAKLSAEGCVHQYSVGVTGTGIFVRCSQCRQEYEMPFAEVIALVRARYGPTTE